ncbi:MAG TPA: hypothetical protein VGH99_10710 [Pseudonocardia sp.]|jgi:hypothetical protein
MSRTPLAANPLVGSPAALVVMGLGALAVIGVVVGANIWLRWQKVRSRPVGVDPSSVEAAPSYRRYLAVAAWAGGSRRNWDHSVRPVLAEMVELAVQEHEPAGGDAREASLRLLGPELWELVDRDAPRSHDYDAPGPGRQTLLQILERVEKIEH